MKKSGNWSHWDCVKLTNKRADLLDFDGNPLVTCCIHGRLGFVTLPSSKCGNRFCENLDSLTEAKLPTQLPCSSLYAILWFLEFYTNHRVGSSRYWYTNKVAEWSLGLITYTVNNIYYGTHDVNLLVFQVECWMLNVEFGSWEIALWL